jgi:hypothetical protein
MCVAVGTKFSANPRLGAALVERWNGARWSIQRAPTPVGAKASALMAVSCSSSRACTAVGNVTDKAGHVRALAEHWNGRRWSLERTPRTLGLIGVSCPTVSDCIAVGRAHALAERWDGLSWFIRRAKQAGPPNSDTGFGGISCTTDDACMAIGGWSCTLPECPDIGPVAERWNGHAWSIDTLARAPHLVELSDISCTSPTVCVAVGNQGAAPVVERRS